MNNLPTTSLSKQVTLALGMYFDHLEDEIPSDVYQMVLNQVEKPLIEFILAKTDNNQSRAAAMLGINRNTLRKKIKQFQIEAPTPDKTINL